MVKKRKMETLRTILAKIDALVSRIPLDFLLHLIVSAAMSWAIMLLMAILGLDLSQSAVAAMAASIAVGVAKEYVLDEEIKQTKADVLDLAADVTGSVLGVVMCASGALMW